jgi:hypothetical protein
VVRKKFLISRKILVAELQAGGHRSLQPCGIKGDGNGLVPARLHLDTFRPGTGMWLRIVV